MLIFLSVGPFALSAQFYQTYDWAEKPMKATLTSEEKKESSVGILESVTAEFVEGPEYIQQYETHHTLVHVNNARAFEQATGHLIGFGHRRIAHGGSWVGFRTSISRYPDAGLTVVVLMNFAEAEPEILSDQIAEIYLGPG